MATKKCLSGEELVLAANHWVSEVEKNGNLWPSLIVMLINNPDTREMGIRKFVSSNTYVAQQVLEKLPSNFLFDLVCNRSDEDTNEILSELTDKISELYEISEELLAKIKIVEWIHSDLRTLAKSRNQKLREWARNQFQELENSKSRQNTARVIDEEVLAASEIWLYSNSNPFKFLHLNGVKRCTEWTLDDFLHSENISLYSKEKLVERFEDAENEIILLVLLAFLPEDDVRRKNLWDRLFSFTRIWWSRIPRKTVILTHPKIGEAVKTQSELDRVLKYVLRCEEGILDFFSTYLQYASKPEFRGQVFRLVQPEYEVIIYGNYYSLFKESDIPILSDFSPPLLNKYYEFELSKLLS